MRNRNDRIISMLLGSLALPVVLLCIVIILTFVFASFQTDLINFSVLRDPEYRTLFLNVFKNTMLLSGISLIVSVPVAYLAAFNICFIHRGKLRSVLLSVIRILSSFPSVLIGMVTASILIQFLHYSSFLVLGSIVLSIVILPFLCNAFCTDMLSVPDSLLVASDALGMTLFQKLAYLIFPYVRRKNISSVLLSLCRCMGEATALFIVCNALALIGSTEQYTFASYILHSFEEGIPQDHAWQLAVISSVVFTLIYYLLFFLQQRIRGENR